MLPLAKRSPLDLFDPPQELKTKTREGFWSDFKSRFAVDDDFDRAKDVYGVLISYLEPNMTSDLRRSRAVVDFMNNLIIAAIFLVYATIMNNPLVGGQSFPILSLILVLSISLPGMVAVFSFIERHYVNRLLVEYFYQRRLEEEKDESNIIGKRPIYDENY